MSELNVTNIKHESSSSNNLVLGSDGSATIGQISSSTVFPAGGTGNPISVAIIADEKSSASVGGSSTSGSFEQRDLNTEISDPDSIVSIGTNNFTLGAGTYLISWSVPGYRSNGHQAELYDETGTTSLSKGCTGFSSSNDSMVTLSVGSFIHTITSNNTYQIRHRVQPSASSYGHGVNASFGNNEVYTIVVIYKLK